MGTKFTPRPLETDFYNVEDIGVYMVKDSLNQAVCECFTRYSSADKPGITDDEAEANANLFVAAPEMYNMLEKFVEITETSDVVPLVFFEHASRVKKILRKARGEK